MLSEGVVSGAESMSHPLTLRCGRTGPLFRLAFLAHARCALFSCSSSTSILSCNSRFCACNEYLRFNTVPWSGGLLEVAAAGVLQGTVEEDGRGAEVEER